MITGSFPQIISPNPDKRVTCWFHPTMGAVIGDATESFLSFVQKSIDKLTTKEQNDDMKQLSFKQSILDLVSEFAATGQQFSIFDVTRRLRELVNNGKITFTDLSPSTIGNRTTYRIEHFNVRDTFLQALDTGEISGLFRNFNSAGGYNQYQLVTASSAINPAPAVTPAPATISPQALTTSCSSGSCGCPSGTAGSTGYTGCGSLVDLIKLRAYIDGQGKGSVITMKQIQSRFDTLRGVSCRDYSLLVATMGLTVERPNTTTNASKWYVVA